MENFPSSEIDYPYFGTKKSDRNGRYAEKKTGRAHDEGRAM
jgi:hypothetical protein